MEFMKLKDCVDAIAQPEPHRADFRDEEKFEAALLEYRTAWAHLLGHGIMALRNISLDMAKIAASSEAGAKALQSLDSQHGAS